MHALDIRPVALVPLPTVQDHFNRTGQYPQYETVPAAHDAICETIPHQQYRTICAVWDGGLPSPFQSAR